MPLITITVGEGRVTNDVEAILGADSVGSCIAVTFYDPVVPLGGLLHLQFPDSGSDPPRALHQPGLYANTGIPHLFEEVRRQGGEKGRLLVNITGGAAVNDDGGAGIGKKNYLAVRKCLWKLGVILQGETVGGNLARSVRLEVATGRFWLLDPERETLMPKTVWSTAETGKLLVDSVSTILEGMFFASVCGESPEDSFCPETMIGVQVTFDGPLRGDLVVAAPPELAAQLATDFLGLTSREELGTGSVEDAMGELANMICGVTLSRLDPEGAFTLAHPAALSGGVDRAPSSECFRRLLDTGEGTLVVCLTVRCAGAQDS